MAQEEKDGRPILPQLAEPYLAPGRIFQHDVAESGRVE